MDCGLAETFYQLNDNMEANTAMELPEKPFLDAPERLSGLTTNLERQPKVGEKPLNRMLSQDLDLH